MALKSFIVGVLLASFAPKGLGHPHGTDERDFQHAAQPRPRRSLADCKEAFEQPDFVKRTTDNHWRELMDLRQKRGLDSTKLLSKRQIDIVLATDHFVDEDYTDTTPAEELFKDAGQCLLSPQVTEGPLYVLGEQVRRDIRENEQGVAMTVSIQVVDVNTCEPIEAAAVDYWSCNSTGVYGGVLNYPRNGDPNDLSLINVTALRGVQFTNADGIATFDTTVPGHYEGRTTHVHAMTHMGATLLPNNTITGGTTAHIGQIYFDQTLLDSVRAEYPYSINTHPVLPNAQDFLMVGGAAAGNDPVVRYTLVGDALADGIFAWIRFGVDRSHDQPFVPAAYKDENGGHQLPPWMPPFPPFPPPPPPPM